MRSLIVHNLMSGFGSDAIFEFERALAEAGDEIVLRTFSGETTASELLSDAESFDLVAISGGDGTAANFLYELRNRDVLACVFPSGTANLLFENLGNAPEPAALARACRTGYSATCDLGEMSWTTEKGEKRVHGLALMAGTGFDAQLMEAALPNKRTMGDAAYFAAALANPHPEIMHFTIEVDGETYEREGISCIVANNAMMQGDIQIVPDCRMDDGKLDVIVLETTDAVQLLKPIMWGLVDKEGHALGRPYIESFRGSQIRVTSSAPIPLEVDGEVTGDVVDSYEARVLPGCIRLVVDKMSPYFNEASKPLQQGADTEKAYPDF